VGIVDIDVRVGMRNLHSKRSDIYNVSSMSGELDLKSVPVRKGILGFLFRANTCKLTCQVANSFVDFLDRDFEGFRKYW
jgi:hypothetical protein